MIDRYYFLSIATRYNSSDTTRISIPVEITVDGRRYTKYDAKAFAMRTFADLDDRWKIDAKPMTKENFELSRSKWLAELAMFESPVPTKEIPNS